ncbi:MAG TPA: hypothetical protein VLT82_13780 [Myxococcaceae bacterium]|nr:hypothetical protein [Myxococcaceae bacterium]
MGLVTALLLAAAPVVTAPLEARPAVPEVKPTETAVSVGLGRVRQGGALGMGLTLSQRTSLEAPAPGKTRLVYRLEVHTTETGFPRWVEARLSLTEGPRAGGRSSELAAPGQQDGPFVAAVACVLRWLQPRDQRVFTFVGSTAESSPVHRPDAGTPARLTLGWGVEF